MTVCAFGEEENGVSEQKHEEINCQYTNFKKIKLFDCQRQDYEINCF